jgi:death-on-curing protein
LPAWIERRDIEYFYEDSISLYGGLHGPPDKDALGATLARPQRRLEYAPESDIYELAASYGFGFARNHCFPDGNKRLALMAMDTFLMLNDIELEPDEAEAVVIVRAVASGEYGEDELADWLRRNCRLSDPP